MVLVKVRHLAMKTRTIPIIRFSGSNQVTGYIMRVAITGIARVFNVVTKPIQRI